MGGIEDLIDSRITAGPNRQPLARASGAKRASEKAEEAKERVGEARQTAERAEQSASLANEGVLEAARTARQAGEDARQAGADVLETISRIESGELKTYLDLTDYINQGKLAGQITGIYIANLAVSRAKIADAAINSAKIADLAVNSQHVNELTASKITSGDITASLINITGRLEAGNGGVRLDNWGLGLAPLTNAGSAPADLPGRKITNLGADKWTALFPFESGNARGDVRGMGIRSDGAPGGANGRTELISTAAGDSTAASTARVRVNAGSGGGTVLIEGNVSARNDMGLDGNFSALDVLSRRTSGPAGTAAFYARQIYMSPRTWGPGEGTTITHGMGAVPDFVTMQINDGGWFDAAGGSLGVIQYIDNVRVRFTNTSNASRQVRAVINNGRTTGVDF